MVHRIPHLFRSAAMGEEEGAASRKFLFDAGRRVGG